MVRYGAALHGGVWFVVAGEVRSSRACFDEVCSGEPRLGWFWQARQGALGYVEVRLCTFWYVKAGEVGSGFARCGTVRQGSSRQAG